MIEPRGIIAHVHRRDSSVLDGSSSLQISASELLVEHDEPERPIHPALEYEVLAAVAVDDDDQLPATALDEMTPTERPTRNPNTKRLKLVISFIFLVLAGTGNVVATKLQAIPM